MSEEIGDYEINERPEAFKVDNDMSAMWAMRKLKSVVDKMRENERIADNERFRINAWLDSQNRKLEASEQYFEEQLIAYARSQRETINRKSITLPHGTIKSRQCPDRIEVDDAIFIEWAIKTGHDDLLSYDEPRPIKSKLKNIDAPGVSVIPGEIVFCIEVEDEN